MNERQARSSVERLQKELDKAIIAIKKRVDKAYAEALGRAVAAWGMEKNSPEYIRIHAQLREKYQKELDDAVTSAEKEFRTKYAAVFAELTDGLPSRAAGVGEFVEKYQGSQKWVGQSEIARSAAAFSEEIKLLEKLREDPGIVSAIGPVRNGKLTARQVNRLTGLLKNPQAAKKAGVDLSRWRESVYGRNTTGNSASLLENSLERTLVKDGYVLQNTMSQDVPEIIGCRISVRPANKYGGPRKRDICDEMAADYPKGFVFTGWHYNCRCACHPLIKNSLLTPALAAKGFIGVADDTEITMPEKAEAFLTGNIERYQNAFPELPKANYVDYRGQKRLLANLKPEDQLGYYLGNFGDDFLKGYKAVEVTLSEPSDPEVFMDTRIAGDQVRFNISTRTAPDGHNPAKDLIGAFKKSNTGIPLTREELSAASDITHEMVHTMGREHSFAELEQQYPDRRDELLDFNLYPQSPRRQALEMVTEWYAREIFPEVAKSQQWALPEGFEQSIGTGYVDMVANLRTFLEYTGGSQQTTDRLAEILRRPDKAFAYRYLTDIIRETKVLKSGRNPETLLKKMLSAPPEEFSRYLEEAAVHPAPAETPAPVVPVVVSAAAGQQAAQSAAALKAEEELARLGLDAKGAAKRLGTGLEGVKKNSLVDARASSVLRGLGHVTKWGLILAPVGIATNAYEEQQEKAKSPSTTPAQTADASTLGEQMFPGYHRYVSPKLYTGQSHAAGLTAGVVDGLIDLGVGFKDVIGGIGKYAVYGISKLLGSVFPSSPGTAGAVMSEKFDGINQYGDQMGLELLEFFKEYNANPVFRQMFQDQLTGELKDYFSRLNGTLPEQGYAQGRLLVDVVSLLVATGGLKKLMGNWKRLKTFSLKEYLPKKPAQAKNIIEKEIKILGNPAVKAGTQVPKTLPSAPVPTPKTMMNYSPINRIENADKMIGKAGYEHVLNVNKARWNKQKKIFEFSGGHTEKSIKQYITNNGGGRYAIKHKMVNSETGVYQGKVVIELNNGMSISKAGTISSFFPKNWPESKIMEEVQYAAKNLKGMHPKYIDAYVGETREGVQIVFFCEEEAENKIKRVISFFPLHEKLANFKSLN